MKTVSLFDLVTLLSAIGCALVAGVFFAFSTFVMKGLGALPSAQGIAVMQSINIAVINPWFMAPFLGTALASGFLAISSFRSASSPATPYLLAGSILYIVGSLMVTLVFNVPRNNALAILAPASPEASTYWAGYLSGWTAWNHVRMVASLLAAVSFIIAFRYQQG